MKAPKRLTPEEFWKAFRALPSKAQHAVFKRVLQDAALLQDLIDLAVIESRRREPARPFRQYIAETQHGKNML